MKRPLAAVVAACAVLLSGCLSSVHRIPVEELGRLATLPPERRGEEVRVIQNLAGQEEPPGAPRVDAGAQVVVVAPVQGGAAGGAAKGSAAAKADDARAWIVVAVIVAAALVFSEGSRYDGWVQLHPMHPVHLYGPHGEYTWVPLAQLDPDTAAWATRAYVREEEGPWRPAGRAPLNRVGGTYGVLLGAAEIPSVAERLAGMDSTASGFLAHIQLGFHPSQQLGILLDFGLGNRQNAFGDTVFEARNALEVQLLPARAGAFHAGGYGQIGIGLRDEDGIPRSERTGLIAGAGGLLQIELTTRLALTGRVGYLRLFGANTAEATIGLSIY